MPLKRPDLKFKSIKGLIKKNKYLLNSITKWIKKEYVWEKFEFTGKNIAFSRSFSELRE